MKLDKRMTAILSEIPNGHNLADIGADHGYISLNYAINNPNNIVIGSDISVKSIQKAKMTAKKLCLTNYFTLVGNGLENIQDTNIDTILISGMGGEEIVKIIANSKKFPMYILSPQKNVDKLRKFLSENDILPIKDYKILSENKFYDILVCKQGKYTPNDAEILYGSKQGDDFKIFASLEKEKLNQLYNVVGLNEKANILKKLHLLEM